MMTPEHELALAEVEDAQWVRFRAAADARIAAATDRVSVAVADYGESVCIGGLATVFAAGAETYEDVHAEVSKMSAQILKVALEIFDDLQDQRQAEDELDEAVAEAAGATKQ